MQGEFQHTSTDVKTEREREKDGSEEK